MLKFDLYIDDSNEYGIIIDKILNNNKDFRLVQFSEDDEYYYFIGRIYNPIKNYEFTICDGPTGMYFDLYNSYHTHNKRFQTLDNLFEFLNNDKELNKFLKR